MIDYTLEFENSHLIVATSLPLARAGEKDRDLVKLLLQCDAKASTRVKLPPMRAFDVLKLLGVTGRLFWNGKKLFVDPFSRAKLHLIAEDTVVGILKIGSNELPLSSCDLLFPGDPAGMICNGKVQFFDEETDWKVLLKLFPSGTPLTHSLQEELKEYPHVLWKKSPEPLPKEDPTPFLILKDRTGAFADLWIDYGLQGKVAMHDPKLCSFRQNSIERAWEKDLLETDFVKKIVGDSHYYCPLDKVAKSLTFLLEIGWPIFDVRGMRVVKQTTSDLVLESSEKRLLIKGKVSYEHHTADLKDVIGAFNRKERFVDLTEGCVGLIDSQPYFDDLAEEEFVSSGIAIKKSGFGLIEELFSKKEILNALGTPHFIPQEGLFQGQLHPYQEEGVEWLSFLHRSSFHGLLADEMGLGKTVQTIAFLSRIPLSAPILIVAPTSLIFNWRRELEKFLPAYSIHVHSGKERITSSEELLGKQILLTSYALLRLDSLLFSKIAYECVVLDEAQTIKNPNSQIARAAFRLEAKMRLAITGTPIENRSTDLWSLFHFLMPDLLGEEKAFQAAMSAAQSDERYFRSLRKKLRPFILRRTKEVILDQLPEKIEQTLWIEMGEEQKELYDSWLAKARAGVLKKVEIEGISAHRMEVLETILRLRQICCHPLLVGSDAPSAKFEQLLEDLEAIVAEKRKVLVYSQFTQMLQLIANALKERGFLFTYLDGSSADREAVVQRFQEDPSISIFLISLKAGGVGLNLTAADYVLLFDPWWNLAVEQQAIDRAHRLGRKDTVIAKRYATAWSIEEKMMRLKDYKLSFTENLLAFEQSLSGSNLEGWIKELF
jgi:superfamily II DNA or RNA helicase